MAYALKYVKLIPMALRVGLAGGATYGSVQVGMWSPDTVASREKMSALQREIRYPEGVGGKSLLGVESDSGMAERLVQGWNHVVRNTFLTLAGQGGGLQIETLDSLRVGLKRWSLDVKKSLFGEDKKK